MMPYVMKGMSAGGLPTSTSSASVLRPACVPGQRIRGTGIDSRRAGWNRVAGRGPVRAVRRPGRRKGGAGRPAGWGRVGMAGQVSLRVQRFCGPKVESSVWRTLDSELRLKRYFVALADDLRAGDSDRWAKGGKGLVSAHSHGGREWQEAARLKGMDEDPQCAHVVPTAIRVPERRDSVASNERVELDLPRGRTTFVNQHAYGTWAPHSPIYWLRESEIGEMANAYFDSFEKFWTAARPTQLI
jgi:hypothetical protein